MASCRSVSGKSLSTKSALPCVVRVWRTERRKSWSFSSVSIAGEFSICASTSGLRSKCACSCCRCFGSVNDSREEEDVGAAADAVAVVPCCKMLNPPGKQVLGVDATWGLAATGFSHATRFFGAFRPPREVLGLIVPLSGHSCSQTSPMIWSSNTSRAFARASRSENRGTFCSALLHPIPQLAPADFLGERAPASSRACNSVDLVIAA
mmetsp:Transcript_27464/g.69250  ORF Transcript_27464/g.69250 Transcript_27464/m.69250 type:complete len:208 (+) Transcript_27464:430-1053(+)